MVDGAVISLEWQVDTWLPLFQFDASDMAPRPGLAQVVAEFAGVLDGWEQAEWFVRPNSALAERVPAACMIAELPAVLGAARADRFVAVG